MKKLALLTLSLCATAAYADVHVKINYTKNGNEFASDFVRVSAENPTVVFQFGETRNDETIVSHMFKVTLTKEQPYSLDVYAITEEGEVLAMQPEISDVPGTVTVGDENESLTVSIESAE